MLITIDTADQHPLPAYLAEPGGNLRGGLVVLQEIFGVTTFMQSLADRYASHGYRVLVPAMFSRQTVDLAIPYSDMAYGRELAMACKPDETMTDIRTAVDYLRNDAGVAVLGFCWGGTEAYLSACHLDIKAAVAYYGTRIHNHLDKKPRCPVLMHFGAHDQMVPEDKLSDIKQHLAGQSIYIYDAGHAFANSEREDVYDPTSSAQAEERTLAFLQENLGRG
jgi:carboxymethylenebutenolidase